MHIGQRRHCFKGGARARREISHDHQTGIIEHRIQTALNKVGIFHQVLFEPFALRLRDIAIGQHKDIAAGGEDRLAPARLLF